MFEQRLGRSVTIDQAAELLSVSRRTIYNRIREGKLLTICTIGGSQRVLLSSLADDLQPVGRHQGGAGAGADPEPPEVRHSSSQQCRVVVNRRAHKSGRPTMAIRKKIGMGRPSGRPFVYARHHGVLLFRRCRRRKIRRRWWTALGSITGHGTHVAGIIAIT